jgi:hypothetical protein
MPNGTPVTINNTPTRITLPYDNVEATLKQMAVEFQMLKEKRTVSRGFWWCYLQWVCGEYTKVRGEEGLATVKGTCLERLGIKDNAWLFVKPFTLNEERKLKRDDVVLVAVFYEKWWIGMFKAFNRWVTSEIAEVGTRYLDPSEDRNFLVPAQSIVGIAR